MSNLKIFAQTIEPEAMAQIERMAASAVAEITSSKPTVTAVKRLKPIYNFKAGE